MSGAEVRLDRVAFSYGDTPMLFDCRFPAGSVTAVLGPERVRQIDAAQPRRRLRAAASPDAC